MNTYLIKTRDVSVQIIRLSVPKRSSSERLVNRVEEKTLTGEVPKSPYTTPSDWYLRLSMLMRLISPSEAHGSVNCLCFINLLAGVV
ncbi:hypothetical protein MIMGU_mgv1a017266mg [Erythranthe guttata]|uniref:Uncharacterized protein n=1 Tax=Erythranthe guttata TaxID=4155 RepID=A0A022QB42_ERYGU|nr:hypothetical protein MIMGU_mgv1a017266mg [Erythranthe guttata]EYU25192.1 hypothetical protein MIMGU_mgv1a017266mg [Erythranthe guttata]